MNNYIKIIRALTIILIFTLSVSGCTMAPKYVRPDAPIPNNYGTASFMEEAGNLPGWRDFFRDPVMQRVIETALENNRDLRVSLLNIEKTRAQYQIQRSDLLPTVNAAAGADIRHSPADLSATGVKGISRQYSASLGFSSFELDIFGRVRSLTEQALETYYSVEEEAKAAQLSLVAETAGMYLQLVADREVYDLTKYTVKTREDSYRLIKERFNAGIASDLDLSQAETILEEAKTNMAVVATRVGQDENYLSLLMGAPIPYELPEIRKLSDVEPLADLPEGLPSALLERRPDIMAGEHVLMAANANIGAARANFFPTITLTGAFGKMSSDYTNLFDGGAKAWSFLPQISVPIFDTGRNTATLRVSEAERDIAVARYEKTVQTAFREVADCLVQRANITEQLRAQEALVAATGRSYKHADTRYHAGTSDYLAVLDAQRSFYNAQSNLIGTVMLREANALTLYKALGGGWQ